MARKQDNNLYQRLGVGDTASEKEIRAAYRRLAKELHPDLNPDKPDIEDRFKRISAAYTILSDKEKRRRYDAGEIDAEGVERPEHTFYRDYAGADGGGQYYSREGFGSAPEFEDFLSNIFGGRTEGMAGFSARGQDISLSLRVSFMAAALGARQSVTMPDGKNLDLTIPEGVHDGQTLRLAGQGQPGFGKGGAGDAYIQIHIEPHAYFTAKDNNIHVEVPVSLKEAVLGGRIIVPTVHGRVTLTVPKGSNTGTTLRLLDKGILDSASGTRGHQYVTLKVVLPSEPDAELEKFVTAWTPTGANPREKAGMA